MTEFNSPCVLQWLHQNSLFIVWIPNIHNFIMYLLYCHCMAATWTDTLRRTGARFKCLYWILSNCILFMFNEFLGKSLSRSCQLEVEHLPFSSYGELIHDNTLTVFTFPMSEQCTYYDCSSYHTNILMISCHVYWIIYVILF